jgi:hypothetical protein
MGSTNGSPAPEALALHNGDLYIQLDAEHHQVIFTILENDQISPIVFDLEKNLIYNASFPQAPTSTAI